MQESKINSTLKIGIAMKQVDGERNFTAPPLKSAPVFGGIAGIIAGEQTEQDEPSSKYHLTYDIKKAVTNEIGLPSMSKPRDHSDLQDMYRRSLAASWAATIGELPADQCIEDIFAGGDGWKGIYKPTRNPLTRASLSDRVSGDEQSHPSDSRHRKVSASSSKTQSTVKDSRRQGHRKETSKDADMGSASGIGSSRSSDSSPERPERGRGRRMRHAKEVNEFDVREDLIAWQLPKR